MGRFEKLEAWADHQEPYAKLNWTNSEKVAEVAIQQRKKVVGRTVILNTFRGSGIEPEEIAYCKAALGAYWDLNRAYERLRWPEISRLWEDLIDVPTNGDSDGQGLADCADDWAAQAAYALNTVCVNTLQLNELEKIKKPQARLHNQVAALLKKECDIWARLNAESWAS